MSAETKQIAIPRFRGLAVQSPEGWHWELLITVGEDDPGFTMGSKQIFSTKDSALIGLRKSMPEIMRATCEVMGLPPPDGVIDLKSGMQDGDIDGWAAGGLGVR